MIIFINVFFMVFFWRCATAAFKNGQNAVGWIQIFFSALNGAVIANILTQGTETV
jgi:hypothetical protein